MTYNVRDRRGRFTKARHSLRDSSSGRFVPRTVKSAKKYLRDETGRYRLAKKYNVRDQYGRFVEENYRHNLRDETTGRFISARKDSFDNVPWLTSDEIECDCAFCRGEEDDFIWAFDDGEDDDSDENEFDWGFCTCGDDRVYDQDDDGTNFCATCLGDIPLDELMADASEIEDVVIVIVIG